MLNKINEVKEVISKVEELLVSVKATMTAKDYYDLPVSDDLNLEAIELEEKLVNLERKLESYEVKLNIKNRRRLSYNKPSYKKSITYPLENKKTIYKKNRDGELITIEKSTSRSMSELYEVAEVNKYGYIINKYFPDGSIAQELIMTTDGLCVEETLPDMTIYRDFDDNRKLVFQEARLDNSVNRVRYHYDDLSNLTMSIKTVICAVTGKEKILSINYYIDKETSLTFNTRYVELRTVKHIETHIEEEKICIYANHMFNTLFSESYIISEEKSMVPPYSIDYVRKAKVPTVILKAAQDRSFILPVSGDILMTNCLFDITKSVTLEKIIETMTEIKLAFIADDFK